MWKFLNPDNELMRIISKITDMVLLSLLWMLLSFSLVGFGPATVALYYVLVKCIRRDRGSVFGEFFHALKESLKTALIAGLIIELFLASAFFLDIPNLLSNPEGGMSFGMAVWKILSVFKLIVLACMGLYVFPLISRFRIKIGNALLTSFVLALRNIFGTVLMLVIFVLALLLSEKVPFLFAIMPALFFFVISFIMEPILKKMLPEAGEDSETDQWYRE